MRWAPETTHLRRARKRTWCSSRPSQWGVGLGAGRNTKSRRVVRRKILRNVNVIELVEARDMTMDDNRNSLCYYVMRIVFQLRFIVTA